MLVRVPLIQCLCIAALSAEKDSMSINSKNTSNTVSLYS